MEEILHHLGCMIMGYHAYQLVQDLFHQQYHPNEMETHFFQQFLFHFFGQFFSSFIGGTASKQASKQVSKASKQSKQVS